MNNAVSSQPVLQCNALVREFKQGPTVISVLNGIDLTIHAGEQIAIVGSSGSGKTTLLHLLGGLDTPTSGQVSVMGEKLHGIAEKKLCQLRNRYFGFIYQFHHLLPEFTAIENVAMPLLLGKASCEQARMMATNILDAVGLNKRYAHKIGELSGGERQRVAIARALVTKPQCVLADEPTGNLDNKTAQQIYELMQTLHREFNTAFVLVTHDHSLAEKMDSVYVLENNRLRRINAG